MSETQVTQAKAANKPCYNNNAVAEQLHQQQPT
jgi:hypothetical protein